MNIPEKLKRNKISFGACFPIMTLILFTLLFSILDKNFLSLSSLKQMFGDNTHVFIFCIGYALILTSGGIDLSAGLQISIVSTLTGVLSYRDIPWYAVLPIALMSGILCGILNAFLTAYIRIPYAIATTATSIFFYGLSYMISGSKAYWVSPDGLRQIFTAKIMGISADVWLVLFSMILFFILINRTYIGAHIIAVGENARSAELAGINVCWVRTFALILGSFFFALSAFIYLSKTGISRPADGYDFFQLIGFPAAYLATTYAGTHGQLRKGGLAILRFLCGICTLLVLDSGINLLGLAIDTEYLLIGSLVIFILIYDYRDQKVSS